MRPVGAACDAKMRYLRQVIADLLPCARLGWGLCDLDRPGVADVESRQILPNIGDHHPSRRSRRIQKCDADDILAKRARGDGLESVVRRGKVQGPSRCSEKAGHRPWTLGDAQQQDRLVANLCGSGVENGDHLETSL